jgi:hypothetical protein
LLHQDVTRVQLLKISAKRVCAFHSLVEGEQAINDLICTRNQLWIGHSLNPSCGQRRTSADDLRLDSTEAQALLWARGGYRPDFLVTGCTSDCRPVWSPRSDGRKKQTIGRK